MIFFEQKVMCANVTTPYKMIERVNGEWKGSMRSPLCHFHNFIFPKAPQAASCKTIHLIHDNFPSHFRHCNSISKRFSRKGVKRPLEASIFLKLFSYFFASHLQIVTVIVEKWKKKRICLAGSTFYWRQSHAIGGSATSHDCPRPLTPSYQGPFNKRPAFNDDRMGTSLQQNTLSPGASHRPSLPVHPHPVPKPASAPSTIPEE